MSIRYELDISGPLHKVVRVSGQPVGDATPPLLEPPHPTAQPLSAAEAAAYYRTVTAGFRADTRRRRGWGVTQDVRTPDPARTLPAGDLLRARKAAGLSQRQLAAAWGLSRGLVAEVERGHRSCPLALAEWARRQHAEQGAE